MQRRNIALLAIATPLWVGCAAPPTASQAALQVQVHRQTSNLLDKCQRLGPVTVTADGSTGAVHTPQEMAQMNAELKVRERTLELGGDTVVFLQADLVSLQKGLPPIAKVQVQALALRCN